MKVLYAMSLIFFFARCVPGSAVGGRAVPEASLEAFFVVVEGRDFHEMARVGRETFAEGLTIRDHGALFAGFPSSSPRRGHVRYVLYEFRGEASAGQVYLVLEGETGRIIEFNAFEAWFDPAEPDATGGPPVSVRTDKPAYATGEPIVVTITNLLESPISYYGPCALRLCGYRDGAWGCIWKECHGETLALAPGQAVEMRTGAGLDAGTRQAFEFDCQIVSEGTPYTARSNTFRVE
jgi:hypothetical protein